MADRNSDEYKPLNFYKQHTTVKSAGFSKFEEGGKYYFCRYVDGDVALISQAYTSIAGRDNGIESVKKNEKTAKRYTFEDRKGGKHGFSLKAGNGQEVAISADFASRSKAESVAGRLNGSVKTAPKKSAAPKKAAAPKAAGQSFTSSDGRVENYKPLDFYENNGGMAKDGFASFSKGDAHYFSYCEDDEVVLISESYTSKAGRDNGIKSVVKNMPAKDRYEHHTHKNGKHYFDLNAGNHQEIATSRWYNSAKDAKEAAARLRGEMPKRSAAAAAGAAALAAGAAKKRKANTEDNYKPLAFYQKQTKGRKNGIESFKGEDGLYYFAHFEDGKIALISEGYPTTAARETGAASVEKNIKLENRYDYRGPLKNGKYDYRLKAGNGKEIARSVWYGSAAAAATGAAYLMGKRKRAVTVAPKAVAAKPVPVVTPKPAALKPVAAAPIKAAPIAAAAVAATGVAAAAARPAATKPTPPPPPPPPAAVEGAGMWGWLKWLLLGLLALLLLFGLLKMCGKPDVPAAVIPPKAVMVSCWDGSEAANQGACPTQITCWDNSFAKTQAACPAEPVREVKPIMMTCWNGDKVQNLSSCPAEPKPEPVQTYIPTASGLFDVCSSGTTVTRLGTNPQFGDSRSLDAAGFYSKLSSRHATSGQDRAFLEYVSKELGYASWAAVPASAFSETSLANGRTGVLGFGDYHGYQCSMMDMSDPSHLDAFRMQAVNGREVYFMKRCGNFFFPSN